MQVEITGLVGIYTDPRHVIAYAEGEVRQQFNVCFTARVLDATPTTLAGSAESTAVEYVTPTDVDELPMHPTQRLRLRHFLDHLEGHRQQPHLG